MSSCEFSTSSSQHLKTFLLFVSVEGSPPAVDWEDAEQNWNRDVYTNETTTTIKIANTSIIPQEVQILKSQFIPSNALHPWKHTAHGLSWRQISQLPNSSASFHSWHLQEASYTMFCSICFDQFVSTVVRILTIMEDKWVKCKEQSLLND
ncbi:uncharacterized protein [Vicugna pacos]|uniref:Uncharacterized protein isoform X6 n=1 Tax=Vicugna pacos TaxID=30538 RepID=A0ABM5E5N8_VICPA